jgi:hypothetical protein
MPRNLITLPGNNTGAEINFGANAAWSGFTEFTFEAMLKAPHSAKRQWIAGVYDDTVGSGNFSWFIEYEGGAGQIRILSSTSGTAYRTQFWSGVAPDNVWYRLSVRLNTTTYDFDLFIDGVAQAAPTTVGGGEATTTIRQTTDPVPFVIGDSNYATGRELLADIFDLRIWNVTRTDSEIDTNKHSVLTGAEAGIVLYAPMDEGTGTAADISPTAGVGTLAEGAAWSTGTTPYSAPASTSPSNAPVITPASVDPASNSVYAAFSYDEVANTGDPVTDFQVRVDGGNWTSIGLPSPEEFILSGLTASTAYNTPGLEMQAVNGGGASPLSAAETLTTLAAGVSLTATATIDSGNLNEVSSSIAFPDDPEPEMTVVARITSTSGSVGWKKFHFRLNNAQDKRPLFKVNVTDKIGAMPLQRPWYSYDGITWTVFDADPISLGAGDYTAQNSTAFTQSSVFIATFPPYPIHRDRSFIDEVVATYPNLIHRPPSVGDDADWAGGTVSSQTDEKGDIVPAQPMRAFGIWDATSYPDNNLPKATVVLTVCVHSGEDLGAWGCEGLIRLLLSGTVQAQRLLKNFQFFVYPNINPVGRYGGHHRGQWDPVDLNADPNRDFITQELESTQKLVTMFDQDIKSRTAVYWIDFHSWASAGGTSRGTEPVFWIYEPSLPSAYLTEFQNKLGVYGAYDAGQVATTAAGVTASGYGAVNHGNNHAYVFEVKEYDPQLTLDAYATVPGEHFAKVLDDISQGANFNQTEFEGRFIKLDMTGDATGAGDCDCEVHESFGRNRLQVQRGLGIDATGKFRMDANGFTGSSVVLSLSDIEYTAAEQERAFLARVNVEATP